LAIRIIATILLGVSHNWYQTLVCRLFIGIGEAAFMSLSPTMINSIAPFYHRSTYLAVFNFANLGFPLGITISNLLRRSSVMSKDNL